jgi:uncharacterized protein (TIGR02996 family)
MHPEADALLDAIFAEPDDDTPRLVYADWLEEHDQANYAAFIRLQCAAARHKFWTPEANDLWEQIGRVWTRLADEWRFVLANYPAIDAADFRRGVYHRRLGKWDYDDPETTTRQGWMWFPDTVMTAVEYNAPALGRFHHFAAEHFYDPRFQDRFHAIRIIHPQVPRSFRRAVLPRLRLLDLVQTRIDVGFAEDLSHSTGLPRLQRLRVSADLEANAFACGVLHTRLGSIVEFVRK